ncbi:MAG: right-handed parallel beta-helix repeat-containing protein [Dysgonamonadaceae bacterium]|jgi:hypothetical protein|nr:right-handed parallel beta-helix repeat-containing protein [Dysgonamonadaceae bacterium]
MNISYIIYRNILSFSRKYLAAILVVAGIVPAQAGIYYVSVKGSDTHQGTKIKPFKTISKGAEIAQPGDTVYVLEGIYRERISPPRGGTEQAPIVYMGEPGKRVFIKGSDVYDKTWNKVSAEIFAADLNRMKFTDDFYFDSPNPFKVIFASTPYGRDGAPEGIKEIAYTLGQVFVESEPYLQAPLKKEMEEQAGSWWYDLATNQALVHFKQGHSAKSFVEISTRRSVFAPHIRGLGYIHVIGFIIEHCGNQFPRNCWETRENASSGALSLRAGHHWLVKYNVVRYAAGIGIECGQRSNNNERTDTQVPAEVVAGNRIENNYLLENGCNGLKGSSPSEMTVKGNVVMYNNAYRFIGAERYEQAGIKFNTGLGITVVDNFISDNYSFGVWFDNRYTHSRISHNLIVNNQKGIKVEMGDYDFGAILIDHNVIVNNIENQYYSHDASGVLVVNNLLAGTKASRKKDDNEDVRTIEAFGQGVYVRQITVRTKSANNAFYNNIICNNDFACDMPYPAAKGGEQRFLGNLYDKGDNERVMCINNMIDKPSPLSEEEFKSLVIKDLGGSVSNVNNIFRSSPVRAHTNLVEWQKFWSSHTRHNDNDAQIMSGLNAVYDPKTMSVTLTVPNDVNRRDNTRWDGNYRSIYKLTENKALPGPFGNLQKGTHTYYMYKGLPPVKKGELPDPNAFYKKYN